MKHLKSVFAMLFAVFLLTGCGEEKPPAEGLFPQFTETEQPPVHTLQCTHPSALSGIYPSAGANMVVCWTDYEAELTSVQIVDVVTDTICNEAVLNGIWDFQPQTFSDGRIALCNRDAGQWRFMSAQLEEIGIISTQSVDGFFSKDCGSYYYLKDHVLCRQNVADGTVAPVPLSYELRFLEITAFDNQSGKMVLQFYLSAYSSECGTAILDVTTGQFSMLQAERYQAVFNGSGFSLLCFDTAAMGYSVSYQGKNGSCLFADAGVFMNQSNDLCGISGAPYLLGIAANTELYSLGEQIGHCSLKEYHIPGEIYFSCFLPEVELLAGAVYQNESFQIYVISPKQLSFTALADGEQLSSLFEVDAELARAYCADALGSPVASSLQEARAYADELEEAFGVRILLSEQCKEAAALCEYPITMTTALGTEELNGINAALERLKSSLSLYPKGFLRQFQNSMGEAGLRFLLVEGIDSGFGTIGCTFENGDWQNIALDIRSADALDGIICHEIWHATENHILSKDYTAFLIEDWMALNPDGFTYTYDATLVDSRRLGWTLYGSSPENVYFVDSYAQVDGCEDRARIMEYFMVHRDEAELLIQSPVIYEKLQRMCSAIRSCFNTDGWEKVRWEELL